MVQGKIKIKRIENASTRQVTFSKRRCGLMKKAHDLSVLCDAEVVVIIFSGNGKLFQFASSNMGSVLERYSKICGNSKALSDNNGLSDNSGTGRLSQFIEKLQSLQSNLFGDGLERLSLRDIIRLERTINDHLGFIRAKKEQRFLEQMEDIKEKVTEARKTTSMNSNFLKKLVDFGLEVSCSGGSGAQEDSEGDCPRDAALFLWAGRGELNSEGLPTAKRSSFFEGLNNSAARE